MRVIRSYLGANSGTYTQREHLFYRGTERVQTFLRVHAIPGIMDFYDYSPAAIGMRYSSSATPAGVTDRRRARRRRRRRADVGGRGRHQGASDLDHVAVADITGMAIQGYYTDDSTPPFTQCTGDAFEYGASGTAITSAMPNTDPAAPGPVNTLTATRWNVYVPRLVDPDRRLARGQPDHPGHGCHRPVRARGLTPAVRRRRRRP